MGYPIFMKKVTVINNIEYSNVGTHVTHCCAEHGCKYNKACPVADKVVEQEGGCGYCLSSEALGEEIARLQKELAWSVSLENRGFTLNDEIY